MSKKCIKCGEVKELTDFYKNKRLKDGRQRTCIICQKVYSKEYAKVNCETARVRTRNWRKANPAKRAASKAKRRAAKLERTVPWADLVSIQAIYSEAKRLTETTGVKHHVDHVIPLQGELVSGLHVESNLQVLTAQENCSKSNKFNTNN